MRNFQHLEIPMNWYFMNLFCLETGINRVYRNTKTEADLEPERQPELQKLATSSTDASDLEGKRNRVKQFNWDDLAINYERNLGKGEFLDSLTCRFSRKCVFEAVLATCI